jgi:hypothetical protein
MGSLRGRYGGCRIRRHAWSSADSVAAREGPATAPPVPHMSYGLRSMMGGPSGSAPGRADGARPGDRPLAPNTCISVHRDITTARITAACCPAISMVRLITLTQTPVAIFSTAAGGVATTVAAAVFPAAVPPTAEPATVGEAMAVDTSITDPSTRVEPQRWPSGHSRITVRLEEHRRSRPRHRHLSESKHAANHSDARRRRV